VSDNANRDFIEREIDKLFTKLSKKGVCPCCAGRSLIYRGADLLEHVHEWAFVSVPAFNSEADVLASRHFRTTEHCWYFSPAGLIDVMRDLGWDCREENWTESVLGRDSIASFAFRRVD